MLQINPYNTKVIQATTEFYSLLGTVGVEGVTQSDIDVKVKEAQQKFKNY
jgi:hypothetical protein